MKFMQLLPHLAPIMLEWMPGACGMLLSSLLWEWPVPGNSDRPVLQKGHSQSNFLLGMPPSLFTSWVLGWIVPKGN